MQVRTVIVLAGLLTSAAPAIAADMTKAQAQAIMKARGVSPPTTDIYPEVIMDGDVEGVQALITLGVKAKTQDIGSPLELAATSCSNPKVKPDAVAHIVDLLVADGADPNAPGVQGMGPMMVASQQCNGLVMSHFIAAGGKLDGRTPQGFTPLSMALITKHYEAAEVLIDAGARIPAETGAKLTEGSDDAQLKALVQRGTAH